MARLLPFLLVASLVVIAASAFSEEQEESLAEIKLNEALAEPAADAARRGKGRRRQRKMRQMNGKKARNGKKGRNGKKARNGKKVRNGKKGKKVSKKNKKGKAPRKQNKGKKNNQGKKNKGKKTRKTMKSGCMSRAKSAQCGVDAVEALKFEGSVVDNFITQKKRALNFKGIVEKKQGKKANFANATSNMLDALGGNATAPVCKMAALRLTRASAAEATGNYATLAACTTSIESDCGIANGTIDEAGLETCNETIFAIKTKNAECIAKATADEKCACFAEAAVLVAAVKAGDCKKMGIDANKAMKASKKTCVSAFAVCNTAEAAASGLINICLGGEDMTVTEAGAATTAAAAGTTVAAAGTTAAAGATTAAASATTAAAGSCAVKCGVKKQGTKIVGGTEAAVNEYPWMAALSMGCGGSVIADKWILTAAHCFFDTAGSQQYTDANIADVVITIGDHDQSSTSESTIATKNFPSEKLILHPNYNHGNSLNDIALLRVSDANKMDLKVYTPVCLPTAGTDYSGKKAWVYGWGALSSGGSSPDKLQELEVTVVSDASAKASYAANGQGTTLSDAMLAVMVFAGGESGKDACQGDSGGPFSYPNPDNNNQHELVGAVSWGLGCAVEGLPGAYAEVSAFRTWVDAQITANGGAVFTC